MFEGGSWWSPPPHALFELGMPPQLYNTSYLPKRRRSNDKKKINLRNNRSLSIEKKIGEEKEETEENIKRVERRKRALKNIAEKEEQRKRLKGVLNDQAREELESLLRNLSPDRIVIGDAMIWCLDHAECSKEITQCIFESLCIKETPLHKKIARIYLVSDILANCAVRVKDAFYYRQHFGDYLLKIFSQLNETLDSIESRLKAEQFRQRVMLCFRNWEDHAVYPTQDLIKWQNIFLGLLKTDGEIDTSIDGEPILQVGEDEDLDGLPIQEEGNDDIDGMPMPDDGGSDGDLDGIPIINDDRENDRFTTGSWSTLEPVDQNFEDFQPAPSKWESVGISRWEQQSSYADNKNNSLRLKAVSSENGNHNDDRTDKKRCKLSKLSPSRDTKESKKIIATSTANDEEQRRQMLREIEMKVMKLQDKFEADGKIPQADIDTQLTKFRQNLVQKMEEKLGMLQHRLSPSRSEVRQHRRENSPNRPREGRQHRRERSSSPIRTSRRHRRSPSRSRCRERSPIRHSTSRRH